MSSSDRRRFLTALAAIPLAAGCGFQPVYGTGGIAKPLRGRVNMAAPKDRNAFELVARLEERLGRPESAAYDLTYQISAKTRSLAITGQQEITRYNVEGSVRYRLVERATGRVISNGTETNFASYSTTGNTVATSTAERDAYDRLMRILADQIVTRVVSDLGSES